LLALLLTSNWIALGLVTIPQVVVAVVGWALAAVTLPPPKAQIVLVAKKVKCVHTAVFVHSVLQATAVAVIDEDSGTSGKKQLLALLALLGPNEIALGFDGVLARIPHTVFKPCWAAWAFAAVTTPFLNRQMFRLKTKVKCVHPLRAAHAA
jgi:hypothetical protein